MDKRYQVFVSSTFIDLVEERKEAMQALLEMNHIPCGMELFPAANTESWDLIKKVIDDCDYYIVIIGGRYGSLDDEGLGYTEKEYNYAYEQKKPIMAFLHKNPGNIIANKTDFSPIQRKRLDRFRKIIEQRHYAKYWNNSFELKSEIAIGLPKLIIDYPAIGWIKASNTSESSIDNSRALLKSLETEYIKRLNRLENQIVQADRELKSCESMYLTYLNNYKLLKKHFVTNIMSFDRSDDELLTAISNYLNNNLEQDEDIRKLMEEKKDEIENIYEKHFEDEVAHHPNGREDW